MKRKFNLKGYYLVALMLASSMILSPLTVLAEGDSKILDELAAIQSKVNVIVEALEGPEGDKIEDKGSLEETLLLVQNDIVLMSALAGTGSRTTAEIIVYTNPAYAEAQVITSKGVRTLSFIFDSSFNSATEAMLVDEVIARTADTLSMNATLLKVGASVVKNFSGIVMPPPLAVSGASSQPLQAIAPRTNLLKVMLTGDVSTYSTKAVVSFGPEIDKNGNALSAATFTYNRTFIAPTTTNFTLPHKMRDLEMEAIIDLSHELLIPYTDVKEKTTVSLKKFANVAAVSSFLSTATAGEKLYLAGQFGENSVVTDIKIYKGNGYGLIIDALSDQNEKAHLSVHAYLDNNWGNGPSTNGNYDAIYNYRAFGKLVNKESSEDFTYSEMIKAMEEILEGIGEDFNSTDAAVVSKLAQIIFDTNNGYVSRPLISNWSTGGIVSGSDDDFINKVTEFVVGKNQLNGAAKDVVTVYNMYPQYNNY